MTQRDRDRLVVLKKAHKKLITRRQAAERRLLARLREIGNRAVIHGLRDRSSNCKLGEDATVPGCSGAEPGSLPRLRPDAGQRVSGEKPQAHSRPRGSAAAHDPSRSVAWAAESRSHPRRASASKLARRAGAVGDLQARLAGEAGSACITAYSSTTLLDDAPFVTPRLCCP